MKIAIVGGGIIGLCSAYYLKKSGHDVSIIERKTIGDACSLGNAGYISPSHFIPLAAPGMISLGLKWMLSPESPFYIKPKPDPRLISWMWKFYKASKQKRVDAAVPLLREIAVKSRDLYHEIYKNEKFRTKIEDSGLLMVYDTKSTQHHELETMELANRQGISAFEVELNEYEPNFPINALGAVYYPGDSVIEPKQFTDELKALLKSEAVEILENCSVNGFNIENRNIKSIRVNNDNFEADTFLLAAGSWTHLLLDELGINTPLQAGKGYSLTVDKPSVQPKYPMILVEGRIAVTPYDDKLRFAGTMEINGLNEDISMSRIKGMRKSIKRYYPEYDQSGLEKVERWAGLRPCSPDGLPYIGKINRVENLYVNFGHAMLGVTLAPVSGYLINQILNKESISFSTSLLDPNRYDS